MAKQEYISVEVKVYLKDFRMYVKVPTKNYNNHHDAWVNGEKLVKDLIDDGDIKFVYNGNEIPKGLISSISCWSDDSYEADFQETNDNIILPNGVVCPKTLNG